MFNSNQAGADGELYAEQDPGLGDYACPPSVFPAYQEEEQVDKEMFKHDFYQMRIWQQVDENYDPTDFLQGLVPGEAQPFQPPPMVNIQFNPFLFARYSFYSFDCNNGFQVMDDGTIIKPDPGAVTDDHLQVIKKNYLQLVLVF